MKAMYILVFLILGPLATFSHIRAADTEAERVEAARKLVEDYDRAQRAQIAASIVTASNLVRAHETGKKRATDSELAAAKEVLRKQEEKQTEARNRAIDAVPIFVVLREGSNVGIERLLDSANREYIRHGIAKLKRMIDPDTDPKSRLHAGLRQWEKALSELKPTGKVLGGVGVTIFEEPDCLVVAYFDNFRWEHFVCVLNKEDYSPLPSSDQVRRRAFNAAQKSVVVE